MNELSTLAEMSRALIAASEAKRREATIGIANSLDRRLRMAYGTPGLWNDRDIRKASQIIQMLKRFKLVKPKKKKKPTKVKFCSGGLPSLGKRR